MRYKNEKLLQVRRKASELDIGLTACQMEEQKDRR